MHDAIYEFNRDSAGRIRKFTTILPGSGELDDTEKKGLGVGWKWLVFLGGKCRIGLVEIMNRIFLARNCEIIHFNLVYKNKTIVKSLNQ